MDDGLAPVLTMVFPVYLISRLILSGFLIIYLNSKLLKLMERRVR